MRAAADIYTDFSKLSELKRMSRQDQGAALKEVAKQFEALFVQMVLKQMRQASPGDPIFASDQARFYREMYDRQLALHLAERGGLGIADLLVAQLSARSSRPDSNQSLTSYRTALLEIPEDSNPSQAADGFSIEESDARHGAPVAGQPVGYAAEGGIAIDVPQTSAHPMASPPLPGRFESAGDFIQSLWPEAQRAAAEIGLDPKLLLAQAALETGWGQKILHHPDGRSSHNLFNLKASPPWQGEQIQVSTLEYLDGVAVRKRAAFRTYANYRQSFQDYLKLLKNPRYAEALQHTSDPGQYLKALQRAGYATDPNYADKILAIYRHETLAAL